MADKTAIEWTDATWNPVRGCTRVSEGCRNCYAEGVAARFSGPGQPFHGFADRDRAGSKWTGKVALVPTMLDIPLRWKLPRRIFVNSMSDLFHEHLRDDESDQVFAVMAMAPWHIFQVLTKRPDRMRRYMTDPLMMACVVSAINKLGGAGRPVDLTFRHVWLGTSAEDQPRADERIPHLLATPAAIRFVSLEPLLGPIDLTRIIYPKFRQRDENDPFMAYDALRGHMIGPDDIGLSKLDWVIAGGESGPGARPMQPDWARGLRDQCVAADVPFFFKQWGEWQPGDGDTAYGQQMYKVGKRAAGAELDGREWRQFPA